MTKREKLEEIFGTSNITGCDIYDFYGISEYIDGNKMIRSWSVNPGKHPFVSYPISNWNFSRRPSTKVEKFTLVEYFPDENRIIRLFVLSSREMEVIFNMTDLIAVLRRIDKNKAKEFDRICSRWMNIWFDEMIKQREAK